MDAANEKARPKRPKGICNHLYFLIECTKAILKATFYIEIHIKYLASIDAFVENNFSL